MLIELEKAKNLARKAAVDAGGIESESLFENWWDKNVPLDLLVMPKIAEEKIILQWKESKMIGGEPVYYLDESHAVCIKDYIDQIEIWFFERTKENGKYYCRVTKKHFLDARKIKENYEILLNA